MEMAYRERWQAEIAELQRILSGFDLREECKWGKPCYTMDGKNVVIIQGFKEYCALGFSPGRGPRGSRRRCLRSSKDEGSWSGDRS
jgi:uncharacterized protein YdeI (YjbR/CyaY-like superfamily)